MNCRNFILSTIVAAAGMAPVSGHALTLRECSLEATPAAGSLTVRGEIFFENNWLTIW